MLDLTECKKIKNDCTKKYVGKYPKVIINLEQHPFIYLIFLDGGKSFLSRGIFADKDSIYCLGKHNRQVFSFYSILLAEKNKWRNSLSEYEVIHNNSEVKRVFSEVIEHTIVNAYDLQFLIRNICYINPILLANLIDADCFRDLQKPCFTKYEKYQFFYRALRHITRHNGFDLTQPQIKKAFHMSSKWVRAYLCSPCFYSSDGFRAFGYLKANNFAPEEVGSLYYLEPIPEKYFHNKDLILRYSYNGAYRDYFNMWLALPEAITRDFPIMPQDVRIWHDRIMHLYYLESSKSKEEEIKIAQDRYTQNFYKEAVKFEFSDEEYSIIACNNLEDLYKEGQILHHCVGSYVNSVSNGREYILFLRKNTDINTPYFTIDVTPDKKVRQIHGLCNCKISEEIKPFIETWAKHFELSLSDCNEVRCAVV